MRGLIVRSPWIDHILDDTKRWEIRGSATIIRGRIALIQGGSGIVVGTADLVGCLALTRDEYLQGEAYHCIPADQANVVRYKHIYAWVMSNPERVTPPIPYQHPRGAVIWVHLPFEIGA